GLLGRLVPTLPYDESRAQASGRGLERATQSHKGEYRKETRARKPLRHIGSAYPDSFQERQGNPPAERRHASRPSETRAGTAPLIASLPRDDRMPHEVLSPIH